VTAVIEAAGGVVWRTTPKGRLEVLVIHRPRARDWSLPKGKVEDGEEALQGAQREVLEETGLVCEVGPELPTTVYVDRRGRDKSIRWWAMSPVSGKFRPNAEVDDVRWMRVEQAAAKLSYERDVAMLAALMDALAPVR
jgi:8-oxo-dGTP diphosphatase